MQEHVCIIARCTHYHNLDDAIISIKVTMAQAKHEIKGYKTIYKVPQYVH